MDNQKFGKFVKELRKKANLTQKELGEKLNVTDKAVSKWERGLSFPDITMINSLADVFGITSSELLNAEIGKKEEIDVDRVIKDAIEKYKNVEERRRKKLKKIKKIFGIISTLLFFISFGIQVTYIIIVKTKGYEYVKDTIPYILNEIAILTSFLSALFLIKKSKIKNIIISILFIILTIVNGIFLLNNGLDNECIVSISKDLKNEIVLKKNKQTGATTYYRNVKFYIWAKPQEQLSYEVSGKIKCQWLETDICSVAYKDKNKKLRSFVATYGDRQEIKSSSYYHVISAITRKLVKWWTIC
ncbi:MAG: helix-turn-helix transcriptional regulator [Clostridia bacterium]|nr:helix-turn-helix transcriptional regulator [Clostridia bacterium]